MAERQDAGRAGVTTRRAVMGGGLAAAALVGLAGNAAARPAGAAVAGTALRNPGGVTPWEADGLGTSVKAHGAAGDGGTDDTAAIRATVDLVVGRGGGTVLFPAGRYAISAPITVSADANAEVNLILAGEGVASRLVRADASAAHTLINFDGPSGRGPHLGNTGLRDVAVGNSTDGPSVRTRQCGCTRRSSSRSRTAWSNKRAGPPSNSPTPIWAT